MKRFSLIAILIILMFRVLHAQNVEDDLLLINNFYSKHNALLMELQVKHFKNYTGDDVLSQQNWVIMSKDSMKYVKIEGMESLKTNTYLLTVNHLMKVISIAPVKKTNEGKSNIGAFEYNKFGEWVKKNLSICDTVIFKVIDTDILEYTFVYPSIQFSKVKVQFHKREGYINKIILYNKNEKENDEQPTRVEITYVKVDVNPKFPKGAFTYEKYINYNNGKICLKNQYKDYRLNYNYNKLR